MPRDPSTDKALLVIPCLNERAHIAELVAGVVRDTTGLDRLIVVADGGSTDGTREILAEIAASEPCVKIITNLRRLQSAGINLAARIFGDGRRWLVRLDAHAAYPADYVATLIAEARRSGAASVVVAMTSEGQAGFQQAVATVQNSALGAGGSAHRRAGRAEFVDHGHHALFDLQRFLAVGGYDENLSHNEDAEFDIRLARDGGRIWLTRDTAITYFPRSSPGALFRQYMNYGRGRASTILRHRTAPKLRQMLPACVAPALLALAWLPVMPEAAAPAAGWGGICLVMGVQLGARYGARCAMEAGFAAMLIHLGWSVGFWAELLSRPAHRATSGFARP